MLRRVICAVLFVLLALAACITSQPMPPDQAQTIVTAAWHTDQHIVWVLDWPVAPVGGPLTVETWRVANHHRGDKYRYEILEAVAPALIGETLVFDGQTAWNYNRFDSEQPVRLDSPHLSPATDAFALIDRLLATPVQIATQEMAQTRHGPAHKFSLTFDNSDRLTLWRDEETQLPVRIVFEVAGNEATLEARSSEVLVDPPPALFVLD